jgi:hypothetical protein
MILLILLIIFVLFILINNESFSDIYLEDPFVYKQLNNLKQTRYEPLPYNESLDNLGNYTKYRKYYKLPKKAIYSVLQLFNK